MLYAEYNIAFLSPLYSIVFSRFSGFRTLLALSFAPPLDVRKRLIRWSRGVGASGLVSKLSNITYTGRCSKLSNMACCEVNIGYIVGSRGANSALLLVDCYVVDYMYIYIGIYWHRPNWAVLYFTTQTHRNSMSCRVIPDGSRYNIIHKQTHTHTHIYIYICMYNHNPAKGITWSF